MTGELLNLGQPDANGFTIVLEKAPPMGNLGTVRTTPQRKAFSHSWLIFSLVLVDVDYR